jgi:hypothetical protein
MLEHFRRSTRDVPHLSRWLTETMRVGRYEIDNLLQGFERKPNIPASLYTRALHPTTRMCWSILRKRDSRCGPFSRPTAPVKRTNSR